MPPVFVAQIDKADFGIQDSLNENLSCRIYALLIVYVKVLGFGFTGSTTQSIITTIMSTTTQSPRQTTTTTELESPPTPSGKTLGLCLQGI